MFSIEFFTADVDKYFFAVFFLFTCYDKFYVTDVKYNSYVLVQVLSHVSVILHLCDYKGSFAHDQYNQLYNIIRSCTVSGVTVCKIYSNRTFLLSHPLRIYSEKVQYG